MNNMALKQFVFLLGVLLVLSLFKSAFAASACYQVFDFPAASIIEPDNKEQLKVHFINRHTESKNDGIVYTYNEVQGWKREENVILDHPQGRVGFANGKPNPNACKPAAQHVESEIKLSRDEFVKYRPRLKRALADPEFSLNQSVTSCHATPEHTLMGLGFYDGENSYGYGGIAKLDAKSGKIEIARNNFIAESSINSIIEYNGQTFVGTTGFYECSGLPPTSGLMLYNWNKKRVSYLVNDDICGEVIHDMAVWDNELWIATDMGLSKGTAPPDASNASTMWRYNWENYIPSKNPDEGLVKVTCKELYHELLFEMPPSSPHFETSIDFLVKSISKKYSLKHFFVEFVEMQKQQ